MIALRRGLVVNVGSIQGFIGADWRNYPEGFEKPVAYNTSKAGLIQLSRSIAVQYGRYGIRAVTIAFGPFDNGKFDPEFKDKFLRNVPLERIVSRESLAATLRYVIQCPELTGQTILVDAGYTAW
jgi:NAD(P)-dependent dehydrogenase (short-subunit alcohol dehydrogenase family)